MSTIKQLSKIKNLLIDAKEASLSIEDLNLTAKLDAAMYNFIDAYDVEEFRLRSEGKNGNDLLLMIRE
jgi:hypothetical protein